jgi:hypothetical protein
MARPFTDISTSKSANPIKNGSSVLSATARGYYLTLNTDVKNTPTISDIQSKYGNRFYNGILITQLPVS